VREVRATRYVTPLREGGSLPGVVEADDLGIYVCKFRGAGQGLRVLVAEVVVAQVARLVDVLVPDLVTIDLAQEIGRYEADEEVQDLLNRSIGLNLGVDLLPGAFGYDASYEPDPELAGRILWLDALCANVDRSWRNPNLLIWPKNPQGELFAIDHGAALYFHHAWPGSNASTGEMAERFAAQPYDASEHILRRHAAHAAEQDADLAARITPEALAGALAEVPDEWLEPVPGAESPEALRQRYVEHLLARASGPRPWLPVVEPTR
jgi:HipA-like protein